MKNKLVGFDEILDEITYRVQASSIVFIEGKKGSGKTALLEEIINRFKGKKRLIYIDCSIIKNFNIEEVMQKRYGTLGRLFRITPKNMVLLADNVQELSKRNIDLLRFYFDHNYISSIIFTGQSYAKSKLPKSLKDRIGKRVIKIPTLSPDEATELARMKFLFTIPYDSIKKIYKSSKSVTEFIDKCSKLNDYADKHDRPELDEDQIKSVLGR